MNTPFKYPSTGHYPESESVHRDDTYCRFADTFIGTDLVITEKLDGGNTCLYNGEVYARSTTGPSRDGWMAMVRKHHAWKTLDHQDVAFYGEDLYGVHSLKYDPLKEYQTYYLFAVRQGDTFLSWDDVELYASFLDIPTVPVVLRGGFDSQLELTQFLRAERLLPSLLGPEKEGFVIRKPDAFAANDFDRNVMKYVRPKHVQTDQHWRRNWQPCKLKK